MPARRTSDLQRPSPSSTSKDSSESEESEKPKIKKTDEAASSGDSSTESKESDSSYSSEEDTCGESYKKGKEEKPVEKQPTTKHEPDEEPRRQHHNCNPPERDAKGTSKSSAPKEISEQDGPAKKKARQNWDSSSLDEWLFIPGAGYYWNRPFLEPCPAAQIQCK